MGFLAGAISFFFSFFILGSLQRNLYIFAFIGALRGVSAVHFLGLASWSMLWAAMRRRCRCITSRRAASDKIRLHLAAGSAFLSGGGRASTVVEVVPLGAILGRQFCAMRAAGVCFERSIIAGGLPGRHHHHHLQCPGLLLLLPPPPRRRLPSLTVSGISVVLEALLLTLRLTGAEGRSTTWRFSSRRWARASSPTFWALSLLDHRHRHASATKPTPPHHNPTLRH